MANVEEKVESLIEKTITGLGYELYDVIYEKEAQDYYLRIFIDNEQGISLEDCEKVNDAINDMLDEANYIKDQYFLEVSSPGIERLLRKDKHLKQSIDKEISCSLYRPITIDNMNQDEKEDKKTKKKKVKTQNLKQIEGTFKSFDENKIIIEIKLENKVKPVEIERKNIATMRLKYDWN